MLSHSKAALYIVILALAASGALAARPQRKAAQTQKTSTGETKRTNAPPAKAELLTSGYLSGEAKIIVKGDQHPVIRIAMAPSGVTIIEFPATDKFFAIHPPQNGDWVEVEKSPSLQSDHHLAMRAGKDLMNVTGPAASVSIQMVSGLVVTLWIYPVKAITQQTHRVVVSYDRDEVVTARRKAGLAVDLGAGPSDGLGDRKDGGEVVAGDAIARKAQSPVPAPEPRVAEKETPALAQDAGETDDRVADFKESEKRKVIKSLLSQAMAEPKKFKQWSSPTHWLTVSAQTRDLDEELRVGLVAVKNLDTIAVRILPGHPDVVIETLDERGKTIQLTPVKKLLTETTTRDNVIPAGATVYFAIVYPAPILGKSQRLRVVVGQRSAADEPAAVNLTASVK